MFRRWLLVVVAFAVGAGALLAQEGIQRGKIKKVDADKGSLTITTEDGEDQSFGLANDAKIIDAGGKPLPDGLKDKAFREGVRVFFKAAKRDGKPVLVGLKLAGNAPAADPREKPQKVDPAGLVPLTELGTSLYKGFPGGLYPDGKNERPAAHEAAGVALARQVQPLDAEGKPSPDGKVVLLSVGMSNTSQAFTAFMRAARGDQGINPRLVLVNGAQGGMTAARIQDLNSPSGQKYWSVVDDALKGGGVSRAQVQAVWIKQADAGPDQGFPRYAQTLEAELSRIVQLLHKRFPHLKLVYLSSRTFAGWAKTRLNPEPYAYESGFAVKWLIEKQLKGDPALNFDPAKGAVRAPWLSWGPYLWAKGTPRRDGFVYEEGDFAQDGTHESPAGQRKVAQLMLQFFKTDSTTQPWFTKKDAAP